MPSLGMRAGLTSIALVSLAAVFMLPPIPQDLDYHEFADARSFLGVPNFLNVATNLPYLIVGAMGLRAASYRSTRKAWSILFLGVTMVAFGSAYYHWSPSNASLVWDRLPMSVGFMGLLVALLSERVDPRSERYLLVPAVIAGVSSVLYWHFADDLRLYVWIQFFPFLILLVLLLGMRGRDRVYLSTGIACYGLAKFAEAYDVECFSLTSAAVSGHSIKHLLSAAGVYAIYRMISFQKRA